jgi:hypothetical protein
VPPEFPQAAVVQRRSSRIAVMNIQQKLPCTAVLQRLTHRCAPRLLTPSIRHRLTAPRSTHLTTGDAARSSSRHAESGDNPKSAAGLAVGVVGVALAGVSAEAVLPQATGSHIDVILHGAIVGMCQSIRGTGLGWQPVSPPATAVSSSSSPRGQPPLLCPCCQPTTHMSSGLNSHTTSCFKL